MRLKQLLSSLSSAIARLLCDDIPVVAAGTVEMVDYYEEQLTRLSLAWLACRTGNASEFGHRSQKELVTAFEGAVEGYQLHSRALRQRVEFAQSASYNPLKETERVGGREAGPSSQEPATRPPFCDHIHSLSGAE
jgi:hypothetical protein